MEERLALLQGNWEDESSGYRIEIEENKIIILLKNRVKLSTYFMLSDNAQADDSEMADEAQTTKAYEETEKRNPAGSLELKSTDLWHRGDYRPYGTILGLEFNGKKLLMTVNHPLSGNEYYPFEKTEHGRFGNVEFLDEELRNLSGDWMEQSGRGFGIRIENDRLYVLTGPETGEAVDIKLVKENDREGRKRIVNADPAEDRVERFNMLVVKEDHISAVMRVFDAPEMVYSFVR